MTPPDPTDPAPDPMFCDEDHEPADPACECPDERSGFGREVALAILGALATAAAPSIVRGLQRAGERILAALREPPAGPPADKPRKPRSPK
jgi:hypothetical protein